MPVKINSLKSVIGVDEDKKPLHPTTDSIQKAESFEELKKIFVKSIPGKDPISFFDDSIKNYPLEVQKEIAEGLMRTIREFKIKTWPNSVVRAKLPDKVYEDYTKRLKEIR